MYPGYTSYGKYEKMIEILKSENLLISKEKIEILFEVGRGCFGHVNKGILRNSPDQNITVAIKTMRKGMFKLAYYKLLLYHF